MRIKKLRLNDEFMVDGKCVKRLIFHNVRENLIMKEGDVRTEYQVAAVELEIDKEANRDDKFNRFVSVRNLEIISILFEGGITKIYRVDWIYAPFPKPEKIEENMKERAYITEDGNLVIEIR